MDVSEPLRGLGRTVERESDRRADPSVIADARARLLARPKKRRGALVAIAVAAALAIVAFFVVPRSHSAVSFSVGAPPAPGRGGDWIAADRTAPLDVRFSEGTTVVLRAGSRARVTDLTAHGASILLEQGGIEARVMHLGAATKWTVRGGPFEIAVTGTRFDASWDPAREELDVSMVEGSVVVTGPLLDAGRALAAGQKLHVSLRAGELSLRSTSAPEPSPDTPPPVACAALDPAPAPSSPPPSASAAESAQKPAAESSSAARPTADHVGYRELVAGGKYKEAMEAADRAGFSGAIERASASDLAALADAARFAGRPNDAREALLALRRKFGATGQSAFLLGKLAMDQRAGSDAAVWFETYLREAPPDGPLTEQALGRLMELAKRGDPARARAIAERYLARYPSGAYASLASSLVKP